MVVIENQNVLDIAIQEGGGVGAAFSVAQTNNISITESIKAGDVLRVEGVVGGSEEVLDYYKRKILMPATAQPSGSGIGFYILGTNFIVK